MSKVKIKPADTWFSKCVRTAKNWTCERCGTKYESGSMGLHCSHIYSRSNRTIRWCKDNTQALCYPCHSWYAGNPADSGVWIRELLGEGLFALLTEKKNSRIKVSKLEEKEIARHYKEQFRLLENSEIDDFESWQ